MGVLMEAGAAAIVGCVQRLKADQCPCGLTHSRGLCCSHSSQACMAEAPVLTHHQPQVRAATQLNSRVAEAHIARDRQACAGFCQACSVEAKLIEQWLGVVAKPQQAVAQAVDKADGKVAKAHADVIHGGAGCGYWVGS